MIQRNVLLKHHQVLRPRTLPPNHRREHHIRDIAVVKQRMAKVRPIKLRLAVTWKLCERKHRSRLQQIVIPKLRITKRHRRQKPRCGKEASPRNLRSEKDRFPAEARSCEIHLAQKPCSRKHTLMREAHLRKIRNVFERRIQKCRAMDTAVLEQPCPFERCPAKIRLRAKLDSSKIG